MPSTRTHLLLALGSLALLPLLAVASGDDDGRMHLRGRMYGDTDARLKVIYREKPVQGELTQRFKVKLKHAPANSTWTVMIGGDAFATLTANANGRATLDLRSPSLIDGPDDGEPIPGDFPFLGSLDFVQVSHTSGTLFDQDDSAWDDIQTFRLKGRVDPDDRSFRSEYRDRYRHGRLQRRFEAEVHDGTPGATYQVLINGEHVGSFVADDDGEGELKYRTASFIDDPSDGEPMPHWFPTLDIGDVVTIGGWDVPLELD